MYETVMNYVLNHCCMYGAAMRKLAFLTYCRCMHKIAMKYYFMCDDVILTLHRENGKYPTFDCFGSWDL